MPNVWAHEITGHILVRACVRACVRSYIIHIFTISNVACHLVDMQNVPCQNSRVLSSKIILLFIFLRKNISISIII